MNQEQRAVLSDLLKTLAEENTVLELQDFQRIEPILARKRALLANLNDVFGDTPEAIEPETQSDAELVRDLAEAAGRNRHALRKALFVQERIMGIIAQAAQRLSGTSHYSERGGLSRSKGSPAIAVAVQI